MTQTQTQDSPQTIAALQAALRDRAPGFAFLTPEDIEKIAVALPDATAQQLSGFAEQISTDAMTNETCGNSNRADRQWELVEAINDIAASRQPQARS